MATRKVMLKYPEDLIKEPVLFQMVKKYDVMPNIRRARVTDTVGEIVLELEGPEGELEDGIRYLEERGVIVEPLVGDVVSFYAEVVRVGRTSITVNVEVYAQRKPEREQVVKVTEATLTYVAIDENRVPRVVSAQQ